MSIKPETQIGLKQLIDQCNEFEGKYYVLFLYESLITSNRSAEEIEPIAKRLAALIQNINDIKNSEIPLERRIKAIVQISENYRALINETGANGILYKAKQMLLDLGGYIIGLITGAFSAVLGSISLGLSDIKNFRLPTGIFIGGLTGMMVGFVIGQRAPHAVFKESETRLIRHTIRKLETTFESLFNSINNDYLAEIKQEILEEYFSGNIEQFNKFLCEKQKYEILGIKAAFLSPTLKGSVGHHGFIKFTINDNLEKPKLIEMGLPSDQETEFSQRESRETTGEQLIKMLAMDKVLHPQYEVSWDNILGLYNRYELGINDCHTYIDKILIAVDEPVSQIRRFTSEDTFFGRIIGDSINFFNPLPEKLKSSNLDKTDEKNTPGDGITCGA